MAGGPQVRVLGLRELQRALRSLSREAARELRHELREAAEPVRDEARRLFSPISERAAAGFRVAVRSRGVAVEQRHRRTTGRRPDFGALQMRRALLPALAAKRDEVERRLEAMLDRLARKERF